MRNDGGPAFPTEVILKGMQGEPAGHFTVYIVYSDGTKTPLIETQANLINHSANIPSAPVKR